MRLLTSSQHLSLARLGEGLRLAWARSRAPGLLLAAGALCAPASQAAPVLYSYTGNPLIYSPAPPGSPPFTTYGTRVLGQLTLDEAFVSASFTGLLDSSQFSARIGTDAGLTGGLQDAGSWLSPGGITLTSAYVQLVAGEIVDWNFGSLRVALGNQFTVTSTGRSDAILPFPRVVFFGTASSGSGGRWTAAAVPVQEPATAWLLTAALAAWVAGARRSQRRTRLG